MEKTKLEKLVRLSGKVTSKALDALGKHGFDIRGKLSAPINRVPRRAPPPKPNSSEWPIQKPFTIGFGSTTG